MLPLLLVVKQSLQPTKRRGSEETVWVRLEAFVVKAMMQMQMQMQMQNGPQPIMHRGFRRHHYHHYHLHLLLLPML
jgi:hypothetical protein